MEYVTQKDMDSYAWILLGASLGLIVAFFKLMLVCGVI